MRTRLATMVVELISAVELISVVEQCLMSYGLPAAGGRLSTKAILLDKFRVAGDSLRFPVILFE